MENKPADVTAPDERTPEEIEHEMLETRQSITRKVAALEQTVVGNVQSVSQAVEQVKDAVKETVTSVKDGLRESVHTVADTVRQSLDFSGHVRTRPWLSMGVSAAVGFLTGYLTASGRRSLGATADTPVIPPRAPAPPMPHEAVRAEPREPGILDGLFGDLAAKAGKEVRTLAEEAIASLSSALKQNIHTAVPNLVDDAVAGVVPSAAERRDGAAYTRGA